MSADVYRTPAPKPDHCECGDWPGVCEWCEECHAINLAFMVAQRSALRWVVSQLPNAERMAAARAAKKGGKP